MAIAALRGAGARTRRRRRSMRSRCPRDAGAAALDRARPARCARALERAAAQHRRALTAALLPARDRDRDRARRRRRAPARSARRASACTRRADAPRIPSSVLMGAIPARVAGVGRSSLCSPPDADGRARAAVLAAAALAGVDRVFALGGAGAIAAMAFGTACVPRVDRIVGPGNAYVAEAKLQVVGARARSTRRPDRASCSWSPTDGRSRSVSRARCSRRPSTIPTPGGRGRDRRGRRRARRGARSTARRRRSRARRSSSAALARARRCARPPRRSTRRSRSRTIRARAPAARDRATPDARSRACATPAPCSSARRSSVVFGDYMTGANHVLPTGGARALVLGLSARSTSFAGPPISASTRDAAARLARRRRRVRATPKGSRRTPRRRGLEATS